MIGEAVTAYGQGKVGELRLAQGVVRAIQDCPGCTVPAYFVFAGDAGPGFSGGPVLNASGRLIGITFGYKNDGRERLIYAYPMSRVRSRVFGPAPKGKIASQIRHFSRRIHWPWAHGNARNSARFRGPLGPASPGGSF